MRTLLHASAGVLLLSLCILLPACPEQNADDDDSGETASDPFDFPPPECGDVTCDAGLLCVHPGERCNDQGEFYFPEPVCMPVPDECAQLATGYGGCLGETVCEGLGNDEPTLEMGVVTCGVVDLDCSSGTETGG